MNTLMTSATDKQTRFRIQLHHPERSKGGLDPSGTSVVFELTPKRTLKIHIRDAIRGNANLAIRGQPQNACDFNSLFEFIRPVRQTYRQKTTWQNTPILGYSLDYDKPQLQQQSKARPQRALR